jgi:hypothetical protein
LYRQFAAHPFDALAHAKQTNPSFLRDGSKTNAVVTEIEAHESAAKASAR